MRILIAEDNDKKYQKILNCLIEEFGANLEVKRFTYAKGVILELMEHEYEFLIQDMQMPINKCSEINITAGSYVFSQLNLRQIKIKTICCSSEEVSFLNAYSYLNYPETVLFSYSGSAWRKDLINTMKNYTKA